jgi:hypothetical protein
VSVCVQIVDDSEKKIHDNKSYTSNRLFQAQFGRSPVLVDGSESLGLGLDAGQPRRLFTRLGVAHAFPVEAHRWNVFSTNGLPRIEAEGEEEWN